MDNEECEILGDDYPNYDLSYKLIVIGNSGVGISGAHFSLESLENIL